MSLDGALEEFDLETVLVQRLCAVSGKRGRTAEDVGIGWSSAECSFDRRQAPRHGANPAYRDPRALRMMPAPISSATAAEASANS